MENILENVEFGSLVRLHNGDQYVITSFSDTLGAIYGVLLNDNVDTDKLESVNLSEIVNESKTRLNQIHSLYLPVSQENFKYYYKTCKRRL